MSQRQRKRVKNGRKTKRSPPLPRNMISVAPRVNSVKLKYTILTNLVNATIPNPFSYLYLNVTNPMISFGGSATAVPYFTMWATGYRKFRVRAFSVRVMFANAETTIVVPFVCPFNYLPPNTAASNSAALNNILHRHKILSAKGGMDRGTVSVRGNVRTMAGFASTDVEDAYVGLTDGTSPPSDNIYCLVAVQTNGIASVLGVLAEVSVQFTIDFIERQTPIN